MRAPDFWQRDGVAARLLSPLSRAYAAATARRVARPGWRAPAPVLCVGNAGVGGTGKTTVALDLGVRLAARGAHPAFLSRGYRGTQTGAVRVDPLRHRAEEVGDEPLLLARVAPAWVGADRAAAARAAVASGANVLVMDDGLQNPTLVKDMSLLVIDGAAGFGNARVLPAGPLREPVDKAAARCARAVLIGPDTAGALALLPPRLPVLLAALVPGPRTLALRGSRVVAFAGIGRPEKFFAMLEAAGLIVAQRCPFPDHHPYTARDLERLRIWAAREHAALATTPKDAARLGPRLPSGTQVLDVGLAWERPADVDALLDHLMERRA